MSEGFNSIFGSTLSTLHSLSHSLSHPFVLSSSSSEKPPPRRRLFNWDQIIGTKSSQPKSSPATKPSPLRTNLARSPAAFVEENATQPRAVSHRRVSEGHAQQPRDLEF
ncbi:hypothetical protein AKJ16_DCAP16035 [Drosera capensis]